MKDLSIMETKESSKTHLRRKLETESGSLLQFEDLLGNNRVIPANFSGLKLAKRSSAITATAVGTSSIIKWTTSDELLLNFVKIYVAKKTRCPGLLSLRSSLKRK